MVTIHGDVGVPGGHYADHFIRRKHVAGRKFADFAQIHTAVDNVFFCGEVPLAIVHIVDERLLTEQLSGGRIENQMRLFGIQSEPIGILFVPTHCVEGLPCWRLLLAGPRDKSPKSFAREIGHAEADRALWNIVPSAPAVQDRRRSI